ncbi:MAG: protocatechuate 3,4-dioxygenase subunit alpha [Pseudomonadales bacterium]|nr:protocatechuate 3,4-dioxygenase subunit alpha [Pseudomonadales bacterium]
MKSSLPLTPSQTVGSFFTIGLSATENEGRLASPVSSQISGEGEVISVVGRVFDGNQELVPDALIEIWQADAMGSLSNQNFFGFARSHTGDNAEGKFAFRTVKPGPRSDTEAPCISVVVTMRGLLTQLYTRLYFSDESAANDKDQLLSRVPEARRDSLIAKCTEDDGERIYIFDICMQGDEETVFFHL